MDQARRLERGLATVRWFGVAFGLFQVWQSTSVAPEPPGIVTARGYVLSAALFAGNVAVVAMTRRADNAHRLRTIGIGAFCLDIAVVLGFIWNYSFTWQDNTWVIGYILPLEGALRYRLGGALFAAGIYSISESLREVYLGATQPHFVPEVSNVTFRAGVGVIVAAVAGMITRALVREANRSEERAMLAEDAARREASARSELALFHSAVLAGVAAPDLEHGLQSMAEQIARDLGFEVCTILLVDEDHPSDLRLVGAYGLPASSKARPVKEGEGLVGSVIATGRPLLARDVRALTNDVETDPRVRAKAAAPLRVRGVVIGVLDVETWGRFPEPEVTLDLLSRLADQIAMVVFNERLRARQQETLERLSELDRMKSDFVAITSHELRTPLTAIRGFVKTMMRNADRLTSSDMLDFLEIVDGQSHRLARLVEDLLMASRIEAGELTIAPEEVAPLQFLANLVGSFGENAERIELRLGGPVPDEVVLDPYRVEQVLRNLLHNAFKFSPAGSPITLRAEFGPHGVAISVTDQGVGIAEEEQRLVFERFHRAPESTAGETEGAGLGLYITKRLVEAMGGTIELQSQPGKGTTFTVRIPSPEAPDLDVPESEVVSR